MTGNNVMGPKISLGEKTPAYVYRYTISVEIGIGN